MSENSHPNDVAASRDPTGKDGDDRISSPTQMHDGKEKQSQYINSVGMESSSSAPHNLPPPPPAPIFEAKNFNEPFKPNKQPSESDTCDHISASSTLPPPVTPFVVSPPQTSILCSSTQPPPPPPPPPFIPNQKVGSESPSNQAALSTKNTIPRCSVPQCPPADLLSAIRAGCQLRKVGERNLPDQSKFSRANSLSTLVNKPKDVQAIYEAVRRRRECMENNSSEDDDDDKDADSNSSGWED